MSTGERSRERIRVRRRWGGGGVGMEWGGEQWVEWLPGVKAAEGSVEWGVKCVERAVESRAE